MLFGEESRDVTLIILSWLSEFVHGAGTGFSMIG